LKGYESLLVVEGIITNDTLSNEIRLSRTVQSGNSVPVRITDAEVSISDDLGTVITFTNNNDGLYKADPAGFKGEEGRTYTLHILTGTGEEYVSTPCTMLPVPEIDSVYFTADEEFSGSDILSGIRINVASREAFESRNNLRWDLDESWEIVLQNPKRYNYINQDTILPIDNVKEICWSKNRSMDILVRSLPENTLMSENIPLYFIPTDKTNRFLIKYSALITQYSLSEEEFDFWKNLEKLNEAGGDIFDAQPFTVNSNVKNINNENEKVLGYFRVSAISKKRIFITKGDILQKNLPVYKYYCELIAKSPSDYPRINPNDPPMTFGKIYANYMSNGKYVFVEPWYNSGSDKLSKLVFATIECSVCPESSYDRKPDFWID
jgi:hypothetical protein